MRPTKAAELAAPSTQAWWRNPGLVYFIAVGKPVAAVKIGMLSITPKTTLRSALIRRLSNIQSSNHELVFVLGLVTFSEGDFPTKAAEDMERRLHDEFHHLSRFKTGTRGAEWFNSAPELLARIKEISVAPETVDLPNTVGALFE